MIDAAVILLSGGIGSRMGAAVPKQYLPLGGKNAARRAFEVFLAMPEVSELIVVCEEEFRFHFEGKKTRFAAPGKRRQDSLYNGIQAIKGEPDIICVHDAARPFITEELVRSLLKEAFEHGAAAAALPLKFTVKEADGEGFVSATPDRSRLYEVQTPQVIRPALLKKGFEKAQKENLTVTDDVSLVELTGGKVKLVSGSSFNLKITTPEDLLVAEQILQSL